MMIVSVKPKSGRLASGAYESVSPIKGSPFPESPVTSDAMPLRGGLVMENDRTATVYQNPNSTQRDTATQVKVDSFQQKAADSTELVATMPGYDDSHNVADIMPHERGSFFPHKVIPVIKTQFGADGSKSSNTAFHPRKSEVLPAAKPMSAMRVARKGSLPSFVSNGNQWSDPNNSFLHGRAQANGNGIGSGRWSTVKRGVVS